MNKGILNQYLLEKNIEQIKFYALEEKQTLNKIIKTLNEVCDGYKSTNTPLLLNDNDNFKSNIDFLYEKRLKYTEILNEVIIKYNELSNETQQMFSKGNIV